LNPETFLTPFILEAMKVRLVHNFQILKHGTVSPLLTSNFFHIALSNSSRIFTPTG